jgi:hypothetical protein
MVFHTENLLVLHVIALACAPAADAWALAGAPRLPPAAGHGWAIKLLAVLTVATYVLAGVAKLRLAGFDWIDGVELRNQIALDNLRKALLGAPMAPLALPLVAHSTATAGVAVLAALSVATLMLELGAPIALFAGRTAWTWAICVWGFHAGVVLVMNVWFFYPLSGIAFLPLLRAERIVGPVIARVRCRSVPAA